jgi:putative nucleotidyltransferase with HDIG domain
MPEHTPRLLLLIERARVPSGLRRWWALAAVIALLLMAGGLLVASGGPPSQAVHLLYLPVLVGAVLFGAAGGAMTGFAAGILASPWVTGTAEQAPAGWLLRLALLVLVGGLVGAIKALLETRLDQVERLVTALSETQAKTLSTFASTIELRDTFTGGHSHRVARNAQAVAEAMNLEEPMIRGAYWAGLLHDLGKIAVPERILLKPGPLTDDEVAVMRRHSSVGAELLEAVSTDFRPIAQGVRAHHERWDGAGYPDGLSGPSIPLAGRILGTVDVFEALTCLRPYRGPEEPDVALSYLRAGAGTHFDPDVVEAFEDLYRRGLINLASDPVEEAPRNLVRFPSNGRRVVVIRDLALPDPVYHLGSSGRP